MSLVLFMLIYCARPEDWIPALSGLPLAKIAGTFALLALCLSFLHTRRLPQEVLFLGILTGQLLLAAFVSPVWRAGALQTTLDFAKIVIIVVVMSSAVTTSKRLYGLVFIQAASASVIGGITVWRGRLLLGRLEGILGGNYSNPNDLALALVISFSLCLALLFLAKNKVWQVAWALLMLVMSYAIVLTGSRGGFFALTATAALCLWEYAVRGRRRYLFVIAGVAGVFLWQFSSGLLSGRLKGTFSSTEEVAASYDSAQQREQLFWRALQVTEEHPLFGIGAGNFEVVSGNWHASHNAFTQLSAEGGGAALAFYLLILYRGFKNVADTIRVAGGQRDLMLLARALRASLTGYVVGSLFANTAYQFFPYIMVAYTTALLWLAKKTAAQLRWREHGNRAMPDKGAFKSTSETAASWHSCSNTADYDFTMLPGRGIPLGF